MRKIIKKAYENVEDISTFDQNSYKEYKKERLKYQEKIVNFLKTIQKNNIKLLDIGSGSSALSYALSKINILSSADCVEPSKNRYNFAEQWKRDDSQFSNVNNYNMDIQQFDLKKNYYNTITIVDNTFSYIGIYYEEETVLELMKKIYSALKKNGILMMEVSLFTNFIKQINASNSGIVQEFEFKTNIGLWEYKLINTNIMNIKSTYIDTKFHIKKKEENSRIYSITELLDLFKKIGIKKIDVYSNFSQDKYQEGLSEKLVLVAKKTK